MALVNTHCGKRVPWHFDSPYFSLHGDDFKIVWVKSGTDNTLDNAIVTVRRISDRKEKSVLHKDLVKRILHAKNESIIKAEAQPVEMVENEQQMLFK